MPYVSPIKRPVCSYICLEKAYIELELKGVDSSVKRVPLLTNDIQRHILTNCSSLE
ncbi:MAG: hypothetical protein ACFFAH_00985 [Promethearchaeota archaeon]